MFVEFRLHYVLVSWEWRLHKVALVTVPWVWARVFCKCERIQVFSLCYCTVSLCRFSEKQGITETCGKPSYSSNIVLLILPTLLLLLLLQLYKLLWKLIQEDFTLQLFQDPIYTVHEYVIRTLTSFLHRLMFLISCFRC